MNVKRGSFLGCNINRLGVLIDSSGFPVQVNVAEATVCSFQIEKASGTYATAVLALRTGNVEQSVYASSTTYSAPASDPRVKHTGAIDVTGFGVVGLEVTTVEGGAGIVNVHWIAKDTNS